MQDQIEPFLMLNDLAINCLSREEYANFLTVMQLIRDRSLNVLEKAKNKQEETKTNIRYPFDIECILQLKIFKNNQKGERVELSDYKESSFLIKVPIDEDPYDKIKNLYKKITE